MRVAFKLMPKPPISCQLFEEQSLSVQKRPLSYAKVDGNAMGIGFVHKGQLGLFQATLALK